MINTTETKFIKLDDACDAIVALHKDASCDDNTLNTVLKVLLSLEPANVFADIGKGYWYCPDCGAVLIKDHE